MFINIWHRKYKLSEEIMRGNTAAGILVFGIWLVLLLLLAVLCTKGRLCISQVRKHIYLTGAFAAVAGLVGVYSYWNDISYAVCDKVYPGGKWGRFD